MSSQPLTRRIPYEEFDYQTLLTALGDYKRPRDRITRLLRQGVIIRVKKGLYVFGEAERRAPIHKEILANLIYGPSYVSLEYALQHHGLIPERVEAVTSVTVSRSREFTTPLGRFTYRAVPLAAFRSGVERVEVELGRAYLLAVPEKALADKLQADKAALRNQREIRTYLEEDLRIDPAAIRSLRADLLRDHAERYRSRKIRLLASVVARLQNPRGGRDHA
jgi:predicted transcriptional regulator of viral defense system